MQAMLTPSATRFVGPLSFAALSRHPVETDQLDLLPDGRIGHIVLADSADLIVVAPATAHWLGAMANGLAGGRGDRHVSRHRGARRRRPGHGRRDVDPPGDSRQRRAAARVRLRVRRTRGRARWRPASPAWGGSRISARSSTPSSSSSPIVRSALPDPAARPPLVEGARDEDLDRPPHRGDGRRHARADRPGPLHRQPLDREDGRRRCRRSGGARSPGHADRREPRGAATGRRRGRPRVLDRRAARRPAPRHLAGRRRRPRLVRRPDHGRRRRRLPAGHARGTQAPTGRLARARARADAGPPRRGRPDRHGARTAAGPRRAARSNRGRCSSGSPPRPGSLERAADKLRRKGVDLLVANDVAEAGSGFGTDTNRVTFLAADGTSEDLPLLSKRDVAHNILDRVGRALDDRDAAAQTGSRSEPVREPTR